MPPKKGQPAKGALARTTIKSDFLASVLQSNLDASSGAASLSSEQLSRAYGLAPAPEGSAAAPVLLRQCPPKWNEDQSAEGSKRSSPAVQVLVLDSSDDEEPAKPLKNVTRGKKDDHACSSEHCSNNPRCLNWLGQDKWENASEFRSVFSLVQLSNVCIIPQRPPLRALPRRPASGATQRTSAPRSRSACE